MKGRKIVETADGSHTIFLPEWEEAYHSRHGAIREARHVFIKNGLSHLRHRRALRILEIGLGTGLNALLSFLAASDSGLEIAYTALEKYPITGAEVAGLNYACQLDAEGVERVFAQLHRCAWGQPVSLSESFELTKIQADFKAFQSLGIQGVDLIYYDAFSAAVQPELWEERVVSPIAKSLKKGGLFVTYSSKGSLRRLLETSGFEVEKCPGPPGKREMLRAVRT